MSYLIDTNILSETFKPVPNPRVVQWFSKVPSDTLFISVLTLGEIRKGIEKLNSGLRKNEFILWLEHDIVSWFGKRIIPINHIIADRWGYMMAHSERTLPAIDGLLAATAFTHNLKLVTRNVKDFMIQGLEVINPFE
jgi:predicted nucleic acid-binding protein